MMIWCSFQCVKWFYAPITTFEKKSSEMPFIIERHITLSDPICLILDSRHPIIVYSQCSTSTSIRLLGKTERHRAEGVRRAGCC